MSSQVPFHRPTSSTDENLNDPFESLWQQVLRKEQKIQEEKATESMAGFRTAETTKQSITGAAPHFEEQVKDMTTKNFSLSTRQPSAVANSDDKARLQAKVPEADGPYASDATALKESESS